jgi:hypothetical protein
MHHKKSCTVFLSKELEAKRRKHGDDAVVGNASLNIAKFFNNHGRFEDAVKPLFKFILGSLNLF